MKSVTFVFLQIYDLFMKKAPFFSSQIVPKLGAFFVSICAVVL